MFNKLLTYPLKFLLKCRPIRERLAFNLVHHHFGTLKILIPLTKDLACPIPSLEALQSFNEIYIAQDYGSFLEKMPLPKRWLDLGCHMGYFSLYLAWQHALRGDIKAIEALLVDADPRVFEQLNYLIARNRLQGQFHTLNAAIAPPGYGTVPFALRTGMVSSTERAGDPILKEVTIPRLNIETLLSTFPPPYDLIKLDIEGAESCFLENFPGILGETQALLVEWHGWGANTDAEARIQSLTKKHGFSPPIILKQKSCYPSYGGDLYAGNHLYLR